MGWSRVEASREKCTFCDTVTEVFFSDLRIIFLEYLAEICEKSGEFSLPIVEFGPG